jgi:hypothetical protein
MNGDNLVIIVEGGVVQSVYSDNANVQAIVIDLDDKKAGGTFIHIFEWPDTQFDEEAIREAIADKVKDFMN